MHVAGTRTGDQVTSGGGALRDQLGDVGHRGVGGFGGAELVLTPGGGTDIDLAAMQVQNRVAQALPRLPEAVRTLGVTTVKSSPSITLSPPIRVAALATPPAASDGSILADAVW